MGTRKIFSLDTHLNLLDKKAVDGNVYRKIGVLVSSCLLFLVNSVLFFFRFLDGHLFRSKYSVTSLGDDSGVLESRELMQVKKFDQKGEVFMDEKVEKRMPAFSFKYQSQNFEEKFGKIEVEEPIDEIGTKEISEKDDQQCLNAADIHNYRFFSGKNFSGFVEEPETMTFHANESFTDFEEENFYEADADMRFLSIKDFLKPPIEFFFFFFFFFLKKRAIVMILLDSVHKQEKSEDSMDLKNRIFEGEKSNSLSSETNSVEEREIGFISENFFGFDFESVTESSSDGYSVKELKCDSDIDGLFSEREFEREDAEGSSENWQLLGKEIQEITERQIQPRPLLLSG